MNEDFFRKYSVLVIDDDDEVRNILYEYLKIFGFIHIFLAKNGSEAYNLVADRNRRIDLIISDWEMPKTDGITFLRAIRTLKLREKTPFIMVTSQQSRERVKISQAKKYNVNAYIIKPFISEVLKEKIYQVLYEVYETPNNSL